MRRAITAWRKARSAPLLVGGRFGAATKATTAFQSLRISPARSRTFFSTSCRLHWQFHSMRAISRLTADVSPPSPSWTRSIRRRKSRTSSRPNPEPAPYALREREALANQMRQAALAARMIAVGDVAVGDQPAQEGVADQRGQFLLAAAGDAEDGRHRRRRHPHPAQDAALIPGGLVEMDDIGRAHLLNELLDDGLARQAEFVDAAFDGRHAELQA